MSTLNDLRSRYAAAPNCKFVSAEVYLQGLTGRNSLIRSDEPSANLFGLLDRNSGYRMLVPVEDLTPPRFVPVAN